jgi:hypothetical protein
LAPQSRSSRNLRQHDDSKSNEAPRARTAARELGPIPALLADIDDMTVGELAKAYLEVFGEPTRSRNRRNLVKRLKWRVQEKLEGGLSAGALARIESLGDRVPDRWRMREADARKPATQTAATAESATMSTGKARDPRLPPPGTTLTRMHNGVLHRAIVRERDIEYRGERFRTLSSVATHITGTRWNGFAFFGLGSATERAGGTR